MLEEIRKYKEESLFFHYKKLGIDLGSTIDFIEKRIILIQELISSMDISDDEKNFKNLMLLISKKIVISSSKDLVDDIQEKQLKFNTLTLNNSCEKFNYLVSNINQDVVISVVSNGNKKTIKGTLKSVRPFLYIYLSVDTKIIKIPFFTKNSILESIRKRGKLEKIYENKGLEFCYSNESLSSDEFYKIISCNCSDTIGTYITENIYKEEKEKAKVF